MSRENPRLITVREALKRDPNFLKNRPEGAHWDLFVPRLAGGEDRFTGDYHIDSPTYGFGQRMVVTDDDGNPLYDVFVRKFRRPFLQVIPFTVNPKTGEIEIGVILERRDLAETRDGEFGVTFRQIGAATMPDPSLDLDTAAVKALQDEFGLPNGAIGHSILPTDPALYADPSTIVGSGGNVVFVTVSYKAAHRSTKGPAPLGIRDGDDKTITSAEFVPYRQVLRQIAAGALLGDGTTARDAGSLAALMIFIASLGEELNLVDDGINKSAIDKFT